jgi:hypothetical protein
MTITIEQVNALLKGKRPVSANQVAKPTATKPDVGGLLLRIAEVRKTLCGVLIQARKLGATKVIKQAVSLNETLLKMEAEIAEIK